MHAASRRTRDTRGYRHDGYCFRQRHLSAAASSAWFILRYAGGRRVSESPNSKAINVIAQNGCTGMNTKLVSA